MDFIVPRSANELKIKPVPLANLYKLLLARAPT